MIYSLTGKYIEKGEDYFLIENNGFTFRILSDHQTLSKLPALGSKVKIFCYLYLREDKIELYGFFEEQALKLFELFNEVSGIGPKTALAIMSVEKIENIMAAIVENRPEILTKASGIGRKTAERIIFELRNKVKISQAKEIVESIDLDSELEEILVNLGYSRYEVRKVIKEIGPEYKTLEEKLKVSLKNLARKK